ncbi:MAG: polymer-forming cytoskeletal protein [Acidobacteriota bacterium]|nr:polymer-forming cytoskeletal protein [Acidobacteriota bacterium]
MSTRAATASRLGTGSTARGRLSGSGDLEIHGTLEGELDWRGNLRVGEKGRLEVTGKVDVLDLEGCLDGKVDVAKEATVRHGAHWTGGGSSPSMTTEPGAWLEGEFRIRPGG